MLHEFAYHPCTEGMLNFSVSFHFFSICAAKVSMMSLLFNTLSRFVIAFLLRSKHLLISWLRSPSTVILEQVFFNFMAVVSVHNDFGAQENKKSILFTLFPLLFVMK